VLQDVLMVVSKELPRFVHNGQAGAFRSWLRTILTNRVRHFLRSRQNREALVCSQPLAGWLEQLADLDSGLSRQWDQEHDQHLTRRMLATIQPEFNPTTWQAFRMLVLEEMPAAEVARGVGMTTNAVYVAKSRVLTRLRAELCGLVDD
jgi:RNA polymerase sigma factor (sigma-70 family)